MAHTTTKLFYEREPPIFAITDREQQALSGVLDEDIQKVERQYLHIGILMR